MGFIRGTLPSPLGTGLFCGSVLGQGIKLRLGAVDTAALDVVPVTVPLSLLLASPGEHPGLPEQALVHPMLLSDLLGFLGTAQALWL